MLGPWALQATLALELLFAIAFRIALSDAMPYWKGRRSGSAPISYRLDAWSQYDNPEEGNVREGDIREDMLSRKTTTRDPHLLWDGGLVRYYVDPSIVNEPAKLAVLDDAMAAIEESTCVKFVRIFPENGKFPTYSWVNITGEQRGCFSDLGRAPAGQNILNLDVKRCFRTRGHALHELLHTLGVYHEHMRPDRDEFINILWENIREGDAFNFRVLDEKSVTNYDLPYDYDSVMHYSMTAFSKDKGLPTIVPMKDDANIGQRNHLSIQDVRKLLITYNCPSMNEPMIYPDIDKSHSDRLEILNLNSSILLSEPSTDRNLLNKYSSDYDDTLEVVEDHVPPFSEPIPNYFCPCNPIFYYFRKLKPLYAGCYHNH